MVQINTRRGGRGVYFKDPNRGTIVFTGDVTLRVGAHTFHLLHTPGHTRGQIAVHVPEERVVFTGDTIFHDCQTWLMESDVPGWLDALERVRSLDVDHLLPGHGPISRVHGQMVERDGINYVAVYHPAAALHNGSLVNDLQADFLSVRRYLDEILTPPPPPEPEPEPPAEPQQLSLI